MMNAVDNIFITYDKHMKNIENFSFFSKLNKISVFSINDFHILCYQLSELWPRIKKFTNPSRIPLKMLYADMYI